MIIVVDREAQDLKASVKSSQSVHHLRDVNLSYTVDFLSILQHVYINSFQIVFVIFLTSFIHDLELLILSALAEHDVFTISDQEVKMTTRLTTDYIILLVEYATGAANLYHPNKIIKMLNDQQNHKILILLYVGNLVNYISVTNL